MGDTLDTIVQKKIRARIDDREWRVGDHFRIEDLVSPTSVVTNDLGLHQVVESPDSKFEGVGSVVWVGSKVIDLDDLDVKGTLPKRCVAELNDRPEHRIPMSW